MALAAVTQLNADVDAFIAFIVAAFNQGAGDPRFANAQPGDQLYPNGGVSYQLLNTIWPDLVASCAANGDPAPTAFPLVQD